MGYIWTILVCGVLGALKAWLWAPWVLFLPVVEFCLFIELWNCSAGKDYLSQHPVVTAGIQLKESWKNTYLASPWARLIKDNLSPFEVSGGPSVQFLILENFVFLLVQLQSLIIHLSDLFPNGLSSFWKVNQQRRGMKNFSMPIFHIKQSCHSKSLFTI